MIHTMTMQYINIDDICDQFGKQFSDYSFTDCVENGSYIFLETTDDFIEELQEDIEYFAGTSRADRYQNTLELVRYLRTELNIDEGIAIYVYW